MVPRFEGPNELWNTAAGFNQTGYANAKATAYGWGADSHNWYGKAMSVLGQIVSAAYGGDRSKYQVVCGVQTALGASMSGARACDARLLSTKYVSQASSPQSPYTKTPAKNWVTHITCANYLTPSDYNTAQEQASASAYAAAAGDVAKQTSIASAYASTTNSGAGSFTLAALAKTYANWKTWAAGHGITKMCGYEGGYSPDYGSSASLNALRAASKNAAVVSSITTQNYNNFVGLTDAGFTVEFPSSFVLSGMTPSASVWAVLEDIYQTPNPPQWTAIVAFNKGV
jgi:hypothetical protein